MSSRPPESGSVQMSGKMATNLETTLRGAMESYNFQLSIVTALFRFLGDSGCRPMDDPLLDQFQRPFSRGAENLAAALPSSTAMGSTKRRESFVTTRRLNAHESRGRHNTSPPFHITRLTEVTIFFRPFPAEEEILRSPQETRGFSEVGAFPLA